MPYSTTLTTLRMAAFFSICLTQELGNYAVDRGINSIMLWIAALTQLYCGSRH
jgi:phosphatidylglycerophosphate synthase